MTSRPWLKMAPNWGGQCRKHVSQLIHVAMSIRNAAFSHLSLRTRSRTRSTRVVPRGSFILMARTVVGPGASTLIHAHPRRSTQLGRTCRRARTHRCAALFRIQAAKHGLVRLRELVASAYGTARVFEFGMDSGSSSDPRRTAIGDRSAPTNTDEPHGDRRPLRDGDASCPRRHHIGRLGRRSGSPPRRRCRDHRRLRHDQVAVRGPRPCGGDASLHERENPSAGRPGETPCSSSIGAYRCRRAGPRRRSKDLGDDRSRLSRTLGRSSKQRSRFGAKSTMTSAQCDCARSIYDPRTNTRTTDPGLLQLG